MRGLTSTTALARGRAIAKLHTPCHCRPWCVSNDPSLNGLSAYHVGEAIAQAFKENA